MVNSDLHGNNYQYNKHDEQYHNMLREVLETGIVSEDRTGTGTISKFGITKTYDISSSFPLITTREVNFVSTVDGLLWFIKGSTNVNDLPERTQKWWKPWADTNGNLGPVYGKQMRKWESPDGSEVDQLDRVIFNLKNFPNSRRTLIVLYNPGEVGDMKLPPCHGNVIQFYLRDGKLSCQMYQRSGDLLLGVPVNIASYSLLTYMVAQIIGATPDKFHHVIGDAHIYLNHVEAIKTQLERSSYEAPIVMLNKDIKNINEFTVNDFALVNYYSHPSFKVKVAV